MQRLWLISLQWSRISCHGILALPVVNWRNMQGFQSVEVWHCLPLNPTSCRRYLMIFPAPKQKKKLRVFNWYIELHWVYWKFRSFGNLPTIFVEFWFDFNLMVNKLCCKVFSCFLNHTWYSQRTIIIIIIISPPLSTNEHRPMLRCNSCIMGAFPNWKITCTNSQTRKTYLKAIQIFVTCRSNAWHTAQQSIV